MKRLIIGIALFVALMASGAQGASVSDLIVDVGNLTEEVCWNPGVGDRDNYLGVIPDMQLKAGEITQNPPPVSCFTDCDVLETQAERFDCYYAGDLFVAYRVDNDDIIALDVRGMRNAAAHIWVDTGGPNPPHEHYFTILTSENLSGNGLENDVDDRVWWEIMWCPDVNGDGWVDLFNDIIPTGNDFGCAGKPWEPETCQGNATDHNEDWTVDLFGDIFMTSLRFGMYCDGF
jgi:hypothetical protein